MPAFTEFADGGAYMTVDHLHRFLADCQHGCVEADEGERSTERIWQLRHWNPLGKILRWLLSLEDFHHVIFSMELNHPLIYQLLHSPGHHQVYGDLEAYVFNLLGRAMPSRRLVTFRGPPEAYHVFDEMLL